MPVNGITAQAAAERHIAEDLRSPDASDGVRSSILSRDLPAPPVLTAHDLIDEFYEPGTVLHMDELNAFAMCPFHFMMRYRLGVDQDIGESYNAVKVSIVRQTLGRYYFDAAQRTHAIPGIVEIYNELQKIATEFCAAAMPDAAPETREMLKHAVDAVLQGAAIREHECSSRFGMTPAVFDLSFGVDGIEKPHDAARQPNSVQPPGLRSIAQPLTLKSEEDDFEVRLAGVIDRVDVDQHGKALILNLTAEHSADYGRLVRGEVVDLPLYMLAAERLFNQTAAVGCTDAFKESGRRRLVRTQHVALNLFAPIASLDDQTDVRAVTREQYAQLVQTAILATLRIVRRMESAEVNATPGEHCRACAYGPICRTTITGDE